MNPEKLYPTSQDETSRQLLSQPTFQMNLIKILIEETSMGHQT